MPAAPRRPSSSRSATASRRPVLREPQPAAGMQGEVREEMERDRAIHAGLRERRRSLVGLAELDERLSRAPADATTPPTRPVSAPAAIATRASATESRSRPCRNRRTARDWCARAMPTADPRRAARTRPSATIRSTSANSSAKVSAYATGCQMAPEPVRSAAMPPSTSRLPHSCSRSGRWSRSSASVASAARYARSPGVVPRGSGTGRSGRRAGAGRIPRRHRRVEEPLALVAPGSARSRRHPARRARRPAPRPRARMRRR